MLVFLDGRFENFDTVILLGVFYVHGKLVHRSQNGIIAFGAGGIKGGVYCDPIPEIGIDGVIVFLPEQVKILTVYFGVKRVPALGGWGAKN